jgi:hypothetical protein
MSIRKRLPFVFAGVLILALASIGFARAGVLVALPPAGIAAGAPAGEPYLRYALPLGAGYYQTIPA